MDIKSITFSKNNDGISVPEKISVSMDVEEALWIAKVSGEQRGDSPHHGMYACLVGDVFNRYWEDGVNEASREFVFETPPIKYSMETIKEQSR